MESTEPKYANSGLMNTKIHPPLLAAALILVTLILHFVLPEERLVGWHHVIGLLLVAAGVGLCTFAAAIFQARDTTKNPYGDPGTFVVQAPYTWTRNPMYLGMLLMLLAWAAFLFKPVALLFVAIFALYTNRFQIKPEEQVLSSLFGAEYIAYKARVRRWL